MAFGRCLWVRARGGVPTSSYRASRTGPFYTQTLLDKLVCQVYYFIPDLYSCVKGVMEANVVSILCHIPGKCSFISFVMTKSNRVVVAFTSSVNGEKVQVLMQAPPHEEQAQREKNHTEFMKRIREGSVVNRYGRLVDRTTGMPA